MLRVRILVVEDERKLAHVLMSALQAEHYDVVLAPTGEDGFFRANAETFDLVLLDLMLPGRNGLEILQTLRKRQVQTPVLILTARDGVEDRVQGLDLGADDYLVKPFALPELLARIRALLRRGRGSEILRFKVADLELDLVTRRATRAGELIDLTAREFELLEYLLRHQGHVVSREMLAREVWKEPRRATPIDNVIDVQITRLRRKVDAEGYQRLIHTVRGVGLHAPSGRAMIRRWASASIRARLTGWYALVLLAMLIVYATATYLAVRHEFLEQLDEQLHEDFETAEARLTRTPDGRIAWRDEEHHDANHEPERVFEVWSANGQQLHRSGAAVPLPPAALAAVSSSYHYETVNASGERWRTLTAPVTVAGPVVLRVSRSEERVLAQLWEVLVVLVLGLPVIVLLAGVGGYVLALRALQPIDHLANEAHRITAEHLHQRLSVPNQRDEIGHLAAVINDTLARLESSFDQLRRFTADASHELRTPLAVVRGIGEAAVAERRTPLEYEEAIGSILEEVDRMSNLVDTLLRLSRGDAGTITLTHEPTNLGDLAREAASSLGILAEERNQALALDINDGPIVSVDRLVLREALTNVLDNAIKYSPPGSTVGIRVERIDDRAVIAVADQGPGVPPEHRERIFDRFFRIDQSRTRNGGGAGLGLAIAKWAVGMHGGEITVQDGPHGGSEFRIVLPIAPIDHASDQRPNAVPRGGSSFRRHS
jgi:heavy metal sensor kinase